MQLKQLVISSFEIEDHLIFTALTDDGEILDTEQCKRLFSLTAINNPTNDRLPDGWQLKFDEAMHRQRVEVIEENAKRNTTFFDDEVEKLEKWAEDVRNSLKFELKELEKEIKTRKTEARKLLNLEHKIKEQRTIKELEKKLAEKRMNLYASEDDIDKRKEKMLDDYEKRLKQSETDKTLFTIKWNVI